MTSGTNFSLTRSLRVLAAYVTGLMNPSLITSPLRQEAQICCRLAAPQVPERIGEAKMMVISPSRKGAV